MFCLSYAFELFIFLLEKKHINLEHIPYPLHVPFIWLPEQGKLNLESLGMQPKENNQGQILEGK